MKWIVTGALLLLAPTARPSGTATGHEADAANRALLEEVNHARAEAGVPPVAASPVLGRVAQERARELAGRPALELAARDVEHLSTELLRTGYRAHRWTERIVLGPVPDGLVATWEREEPESFRTAVLGDFRELGVGRAGAPPSEILVLLLALPRLDFQLRRAEPLRDVEGTRQRVLATVNSARKTEGRPPLATDPALDRVAQSYAVAMLEGGFYGHEDPGGGRVGERVAAEISPRPRFVAENIAKGLFEPEEVVERWMLSSGHRHNILHRRAEITGIGVAVGVADEEVDVLWVQLFASDP